MSLHSYTVTVMPIPSNCTHFVFGGRRGLTETWQTGIFSNVVGINLDIQNTMAANFYTALTGTGALWTQHKGYCAATTYLDYVKAYAYVTGGTKADFIGIYTPATPTGGVSAATIPLQCALVVTTLTGRAGRSNRGRMYLPVDRLASPTGTEAQYAQADVTQIAGGVTQTLNAMKTGGSPMGNPVVASRTKGTLYYITSIRVDGKIDVQRRRANHATALYSATGTITS